MGQPSTRLDPWKKPTRGTMGTAIFAAVAYADVFDHPLTADEIHRYLVGRGASVRHVRLALNDGSQPEHIVRSGRYFTLPGREEVVEIRRRREGIAARLWPTAVRWGTAIARLPLVRMVAVTGALSVDNPGPRDDVDFLVVTAVDRVWICRAMIIQLVVKPAARRGTRVCPNYVLSARALTEFNRNLYTAHEIVQMVPLAGGRTYRELLRSNRWVASFLPNAYGRPRRVGQGTAASTRRLVRDVSETALRSGVGGRLEQWEMKRKIRRFGQQNGESSEASFCPDWCKGHFEGHGELVRHAFFQRLESLIATQPVGAA